MQRLPQKQQIKNFNDEVLTTIKGNLHFLQIKDSEITSCVCLV